MSSFNKEVNTLGITGTFLDEISHDIPHQNWGPAEWDADFAHMVEMGIDTVILIRCGYRKFLTYPSDYLIENQGCFSPGEDLVALFLDLASKHGLKFYFGTYDSGAYWDSGDMREEIDLNCRVIEEAWKRYGHHKAFQGWYLSLELSRRTAGEVEAISRLGLHCKSVSSGLPVMISPWIDGVKAVPASGAALTRPEGVSLATHKEEWSQILSGIQGAVDIVAFQDGHVSYEDLEDFLRVNKSLAEDHGMVAWTNLESFDRDMPIKFLPIKFEKLRLKLEAARRAGYEKVITFEFSHFMSPQSAYPQAGHLFNRYLDYLKK